MVIRIDDEHTRVPLCPISSGGASKASKCSGGLYTEHEAKNLEFIAWQQKSINTNTLDAVPLLFVAFDANSLCCAPGR